MLAWERPFSWPLKLNPKRSRRPNVSRMRRLFPLLLLALLALAPAAFANEPAAQREIDYLISEVEHSRAVFVRNGSEHAPADAASHLRMKLRRAGDRVHTAEEFIEGVASKSSLTGRPYLMRTADGKTEPTCTWLKAKLIGYRAAHSPPGPR